MALLSLSLCCAEEEGGKFVEKGKMLCTQKKTKKTITKWQKFFTSIAEIYLLAEI